MSATPAVKPLVIATDVRGAIILQAALIYIRMLVQEMSAGHVMMNHAVLPVQTARAMLAQLIALRGLELGVPLEVIRDNPPITDIAPEVMTLLDQAAEQAADTFNGMIHGILSTVRVSMREWAEATGHPFSATGPSGAFLTDEEVRVLLALDNEIVAGTVAPARAADEFTNRLKRKEDGGVGL